MVVVVVVFQMGSLVRDGDSRVEVRNLMVRIGMDMDDLASQTGILERHEFLVCFVSILSSLWYRNYLRVLLKL